MIIGLTGGMVCGKHYLARFLAEKCFVAFAFSDVLNDELNKMKIPITRESQQDLGNELRNRFGSGELAKRLVLMMEHGKNYVIDGIRNPGEIEVLKKEKDFILIAIDSSQENRFKRIIKRNMERDPKTWEEFLKADARDFDDGTINGLQIKKCMKEADEVIENNGSLEEFKNKIEEFYNRRIKMLIGLVGKPSCGKSTFFKACTLADVLIASYPFATIKPNHGVGYVKIDCLEKEFNVKCNPNKGYCVNGNRFVPVELMDVAGLVEGASEGKGLGNQFLDNLTSADAFIHIVDISGETDAEGKETKDYNPVQDIEMLESELDKWYLGILKKVWKSFARTIQNTKSDFAKAVAKQFSGLKVVEDDVKDVVRKGNYNTEKPSDWSDEELLKFSHDLRHLTKPMIIAANKCDMANSRKNLERLKLAYPELMIIPCSADSELALREASYHELINYIPGEGKFQEKGKLSEKQKKALDSIQKNVLNVYNSTGVQEVLNKVVFELLNYIAVFPASANKLADSKGNILPDCFLLKNGSTALDFAYALHSDFGDNFIKAINAKTKQAVGKEYKLKHRDGLEIVTR